MVKKLLAVAAAAVLAVACSMGPPVASSQVKADAQYQEGQLMRAIYVAPAAEPQFVPVSLAQVKEMIGTAEPAAGALAMAAECPGRSASSTAVVIDRSRQKPLLL